MEEMRQEDSEIFESADYGYGFGTITSYPPCAAWTWLVHGKESPKVIGYNDI